MTVRSIWDSRLIIHWLNRNHTARDSRNMHLFVVVTMFLVCAAIYYVDQISLLGINQFSTGFFATVHDLHRVLFFIPIIYASLLFRVRGCLVSSFVFLCIVLPRALLISPYPDPLLRPLVFIAIAAFTSLLIATQLNRIEREMETSAELEAAYKRLSDAHNQLIESQDQLIQAEKVTLLGEIAASFVHEVKNPMAAATVLVKLLRSEIFKDKGSHEAALDYLSKIESALASSNGLVQNVLDFSRKTELSFSLCEINNVLEKALEFTAYSAKGRNIKINKIPNDSLPKVMIDADQMQQVYMNLILNAIQAMPEGGSLTIHTATDGNWLKTEVEDTGCGISLENMDRLFTPFFSTKDKGQGVGLGLFICRQIIRRHQGRIEVQSEEGRGTKFTIYLPLVVGEKRFEMPVEEGGEVLLLTNNLS